MNRKLWYCFPVIVALVSVSCEDETGTSHLPCIKGKYLGRYCEGIVIQILDDTKIGKDWQNIYTNQEYNNAVVASLDSLLIKSGFRIHLFSSVDSTFYFEYRDGGYPRKQYNVCEPSPFITVITITDKPCTKNETE